MMLFVRWHDQRIRLLASLLEQGQTHRAIAAQIGCSLKSVRNRIQKMHAEGDARLPEKLRVRLAKFTDESEREKREMYVAPRIEPRDPCFRCGVRRDIGCKHTAWEKTA